MRKYTVLGRGFIGSALAKSLDGKVYHYLRPDVDVVFHFASPSSNILFNQAQDYCIEETIISFLNVVRFCREHKIKLIYPSSATVYGSIKNNYAYTKRALENIHMAYGDGMLGLRIFAGYGIGEEHKGDYASIVYQFAKQMLKGECPTIYGDGTQTRDFTYITDIIDTIKNNINQTGFLDIGTGVSTTFNDVVSIINQELNTDIQPLYINKPTVYVQDTVCSDPIQKYIPIQEGIKILLTYLRGGVR